MSIASATAANARIAPRPLVRSRYHATPPKTTASDTRSATESKNAPRGEARPEVRATDPSSRSTSPLAVSATTAHTRWPDPTRSAVRTDSARPNAVSPSGPIPARSRPRPMGVSPRDTVARRRPSSMGYGAPSGGVNVAKTLPPHPLDSGHGPAPSIRRTQGCPTSPATRERLEEHDPAREVVGGDVSDGEDPQRGA